MKPAIACLLWCSSLLLACGGSSSSPTGGNGGSVGGGGNGGVGGGGNGGATGGGGNGGSGGGSGGASGGGDMAMLCGAPTDCSSGQVCCARIPLTGGTIPNCTAGPVHVACEASGNCPTTLPISCTSTDVVRYCKKTADCTEPQHDKCCGFMQGGMMVHFCASDLEANLGGGTCL